MNSIVSKVPGYNSWPMISRAGSRLVCIYSRGSEHTINENLRNVYSRYSDDGGKCWSKEFPVSTDPVFGEVPAGKGQSPDGKKALFWVRRCTGYPFMLYHDLYQTEDGIHYEKIATPSPDPAPMQITDIFHLPGGVMMSLWFAGDYGKTGKNFWGTLTSTDEGLHWVQHIVEKDLPKEEWPTEPSAVYLGNGKILAVARRESSGKDPSSPPVQFQLLSEDNGVSWSKFPTNIGDISESTPSLILAEGGVICNYYYQRFAGLLKRRMGTVEALLKDPCAWSEPQIIAEGSCDGCHAGNVNSVDLNGRHFLAFYSGDSRNTAVLVHSAEYP